MPAELHLAEDAFALHLSLQRLEGLIDIVVADENLHVVLLFNPTVDQPNSQGAWATGARICATDAWAYIYTASDHLGGEKLPHETFSREVHCVYTQLPAIDHKFCSVK